MDRSFAARLPLTRRHGSRRRRRGDARSVLARGLGALESVRAHRRARVALLCTALALPVLGGGWLWLRGSSLVAIERVQLSGVRGPERAQVELALRGAARRMTTLDFDAGSLRAAVAAYPVVRSLSARTSFPHGLRIEVTEQLPVAALRSGGWRSAVAADGVVLGTAALTPGLAELDYPRELQAGARVAAQSARALLAVMGAAPGALAGQVARLLEGQRGLTVQMRDGLTVYFGDATHARAKWIALAGVLADSHSAGASYVDVRLPQRPAAGFAAGAGPAGGTGGAGGTGSEGGEGGEAATSSGASSEASVQALAEELREASVRDGGAPVAATGSSEAAPTGSSEAAAAGSSEAAAAGGSPSSTEAAQAPGASSAGEAPASPTETTPAPAVPSG